MRKDIYLNDSIHGLISLTEYERRIVSTMGFNRLHDVYQNSTVYLTFPSNRTKRFEHSIGTMKLSSDMFYQSILNASECDLEQFFGIFRKEYSKILVELRQQTSLVREKLGDRIPTELPILTKEQLRHPLIPNNIVHDQRVFHLLLIESVRAAALLHDIGHPPFSHIVEYALKSVYQEYKEKPMLKHQNAFEFLSVMSRYFEGNKKLHEQMGDEISDGILKKIIPDCDREDADYNMNLFELLVMESVKRIFADQGAFQYLHRIIDSSLDGDRLDYVTRDVLSSGKESGKVEYSRIINSMKLIVKEDKIFFCVPLKAVSSVEDFLKRRYTSYKEIIYHHKVIKTDFILEHVVKDLVIAYLEKESFDSSENSEVLIPFDISGLWFPLGEKKSAVQANALCQWNDAWLMTVLRQIYYTKYYHNSSILEDSKEYVLVQRLTELLKNSKRYHSIIKRSENFKVVDDKVKAVILMKGNALTERYQEFEGVKQLIEKAKKNSSGFILSYLHRYATDLGLRSFEEKIANLVAIESKSVLDGIKTYDTVTLFRRISVGMDDPIYFYNNRDEICTLNDISGIQDILQLDSDYLPVFYIYIMAKDREGVLKEKREELLGSIGTKIGEMILSDLLGENKILYE